MSLVEHWINQGRIQVFSKVRTKLPRVRGTEELISWGVWGRCNPPPPPHTHTHTHTHRGGGGGGLTAPLAYTQTFRKGILYHKVHPFLKLIYNENEIFFVLRTLWP